MPDTRHPSDYVLQFARVVGSSVSPDTGAVMLNVEGISGGDPDTTEGSLGVEFFGALGLVARPMPPDTVGGTPRHVDVVAQRTADGLVPLAARDVRLNQSFANPQPGDIVLVGYGSNFLKMAANGDVFLVATTDATPQGQMVQLQHRRDGLAYVAPWGKLTYDAGGLHVLHHTGARIDVGGIGGITGLDQLGTYVMLAASLIKLQAAAVSVGPDAGVHDNAVKASPLEALLGVLANAATLAAAESAASAAAFVSLGAIVALAPAAPALTAAGTAATAAAAAWTTVATAIAAALPPVSPTSIRSQSLTVT